jgi:hypothetical protein
MGAVTGFDPDKARLNIGEQAQHFPSTQLPLQNRLPVRIHAVDLENALGDVETDGDGVHENLLQVGATVCSPEGVRESYHQTFVRQCRCP